MKLVLLVGAFALPAFCSPLFADVVDPLSPSVVASIHDEPIDGLGDSIQIGPTHGEVSSSATAEDRAVHEFDLSDLLLTGFTDVYLAGRISAADTTDTGVRVFDFLLYAGNGSAELADFQIAATFVGSEQFHPPTDTSFDYFIQVTDVVDTLIQGGATHIGLRVQSASNPSATSLLSSIDSFLLFEDCPGQSGIPFCAGLGLCPCGNAGSGQGGCDNSGPGVGGAELIGFGAPVSTSDSFGLSVAGLPGARPGICIKGSVQLNGGNGNPVGDGLLCTAPQLRSQVIVSDANGNVIMDNWRGQPFGSYPGVANIGASTHYQWWYRDLSNPCSGQGFNFSNGWSTFWL